MKFRVNNVNKRKAARPILLGGLIALFVILGQPLLRHDANAQTPARTPNVGLVLVIDDSGSMAENDPSNLRVAAAKLLISLLDLEDRVALIRFSDASHILSELTTIDSESSKKNLIARVTDFYSDGGTNINAAMSDAREVLKDRNPSNRHFIVFLTDGQADDQHIAADIANDIRVPIYSIALGEQTDVSFLQGLSASTRGAFFEAKRSLDLPDVYLRILGQIQDRVIIGPGQVNAGEEVPLLLHRYADRVAFIAVTERDVSVELIDPMGNVPSNTTVYSDPRFNVSVPNQTMDGEWTIRLSGQGRAHVQAVIISTPFELRLESPLDAFSCLGSPMRIHASLVSPSNIEPPQLDDQMVAEVFFPGGRMETLQLHGNLIFEGTLEASEVNEEGTFQVVLRATAEGLPLVKTSLVTVRACPQLSVESPVGTGNPAGYPFDVTVQIHDQGQPVDGGDMQVTIKQPVTGYEVEIPVALQEGGTFRGTHRLDTEGDYQIEAVLRNAKWGDTVIVTGVSSSFSVESLILTLDNTTLPIGKVSLSELEQGIAVNLGYSSNLRLDQPLEIVSQTEGFRFEPSVLTVPAGDAEGEFEFRIVSDSSDRGGQYRIQGLIDLPGNEPIELRPGASLDYELGVKTWFEENRLLVVGGTFLALIAIVAIIVAIIWKLARAPKLFGTLVYRSPDGDDYIGLQDKRAYLRIEDRYVTSQKNSDGSSLRLEPGDESIIVFKEGEPQVRIRGQVITEDGIEVYSGETLVAGDIRIRFTDDQGY